MALEREKAAYRRLLPDLLAGGHHGRFALIKGYDLVGVWDSASDALEAGRDRFGLEPIAVVKIDSRGVRRLQHLQGE